MPRNGSGSYALPQAPFVPNTTIASLAVNADFADIALALTGSIAADGQTQIIGTLQGLGTGTPTNVSYGFAGDTDSGIYPETAGNVGVAVNGLNVATFTPQGITSNSITPIGAVIDFAGGAPPPQWVFCYGQALSTTTYAKLFGVIGYGYGGSGPSFNVPDCRGRVIFGADSGTGRITLIGGSPGAVGGAQSHQLNITEIPFHSHGVNDPLHFHGFTAGTPGPAIPFSSGGGIAGYNRCDTGNFNTALQSTGITIQANGGGQAHSILNPAIVLNKIIFAGV